MITNTATRQIAYSKTSGTNIVLPAGANVIQRRSNLQPHRKLSRISVSTVATPIWEQQVLQPSPSLQQRFAPKEESQEYVQPTVELSAQPPQEEPQPNILQPAIFIPPAGSHVIPLPQEETKINNASPSLSQSNTDIPELPDLAFNPDNSEFQADLLQTVQNTISPTPKRKEELATNLKLLEENLAVVDNDLMPDLSNSLQQITDLRSKVQEQEKKVQQIRDVSESNDFEANTKAKKALLSNLEHALINTQNELAHLEKQPNADTTLIKQIKDRLTFQKRAFDQLQREHQDLLSSKTVAKLAQENRSLSSSSPVMQNQQPPAPAIPTPVITSIPNAINGTIMTTDGKLITGAVVIVKNSEGRPLRALKTNQLGQFLITTALGNGDYLIETESDGLVFDTVRVTLNGDVVQPIAIKAK